MFLPLLVLTIVEQAVWLVFIVHKRIRSVIKIARLGRIIGECLIHYSVIQQ